MQLGGVHRRLPCGQCAHRDRCGFGKAERFWFRGHFPLLDRDVLRPATSEGWVTVDCITRFKACYFRARFLHDPSDVVTRNQRQMRPEFPRVLAAEGERIGWYAPPSNSPPQHLLFHLRARELHLPWALGAAPLRTSTPPAPHTHARFPLSSSAFRPRGPSEQ